MLRVLYLLTIEPILIKHESSGLSIKSGSVCTGSAQIHLHLSHSDTEQTIQNLSLPFYILHKDKHKDPFMQTEFNSSHNEKFTDYVLEKDIQEQTAIITIN